MKSQIIKYIEAQSKQGNLSPIDIPSSSFSFEEYISQGLSWSLNYAQELSLLEQSDSINRIKWLFLLALKNNKTVILEAIIAKYPILLTSIIINFDEPIGTQSDSFWGGFFQPSLWKVTVNADPLNLAIALNNTALASMLIEKLGSLKQKAAPGSNWIMQATDSLNVDMVRLLLNNEAYVHVITESQMTLAHIVVGALEYRGYTAGNIQKALKIIQLLKNSGIDLKTIDSEGRSACSCAKNKEIQNALKIESSGEELFMVASNETPKNLLIIQKKPSPNSTLKMGN